MTEPIILNCVAVDDEPPALNLVSAFVEQTHFLHLAGRFDNATKALQLINSQPVDLVFLDIQMPNLNGLELANLIGRSTPGRDVRVIFTTAYNQFASESYQVEALDYLLKPFGYSDFLKAATKARNYFMEARKDPVAAVAQNDFMFVKSDYKLVRVDFNAILFLESLNGYVRIHLDNMAAPIVSVANLKSIEERLPAGKFIRLHRSFIVAISKISSIGKNAVHIDQHEIPIGELYKDSFHEALMRWS